MTDVQETIKPVTTAEQDRHTAGQRRVNFIWESTQAFIAIGITLAIIYTNANGFVTPELSNAFFLIVGFYFGRTNHQRVGGVNLGR